MKTLLTVLLLVASAFAAENAVLRNGFAVRHQRHEVQGEFTRLYLNTPAEPESYVDVATASIERYEEAPPEPKPQPAAAAPRSDVRAIVNDASDKHQIDADFIHSVIQAESAYRSNAVSPKGARGLMQLMPKTASRLGVQDSFDPASNVDGGTRYLRELLVRYHNDPVKALAAYNAGPQAVERYRGVPPYRETRAYVARIIRDYNARKRAARAAAQKSHTVVATPAPAAPGQ